MSPALSLRTITRTSGHGRKSALVIVPARLVPLAHDRNALRRRIREAARTSLRFPDDRIPVITVLRRDVPRGRQLRDLLVALAPKSVIISQ